MRKENNKIFRKKRNRIMTLEESFYASSPNDLVQYQFLKTLKKPSEVCYMYMTLLVFEIVTYLKQKV